MFFLRVRRLHCLCFSYCVLLFAVIGLFPARPVSALSAWELRPKATLRLVDTEKANGGSAVAFAPVTHQRCRHIEATWRMRMDLDTAGAAFALLNLAQPAVAKGGMPEAVATNNPALPGALAVAFDADDPPTQNPFNAQRNIYNRPQREVALYWDGQEIVRRLSPAEFRGKEARAIRVLVEYVTGGAEMSVFVGNTPVFDRFFVPGAMPYASRAAFGGKRKADKPGVLEIADAHVVWSNPVAPAAPPKTVVAIDGEIIDKDNGKRSRMVAFPTNTDAYGRIICTLTLAATPTGFDPWDRKAGINLYTASGEKFELVRFITPYRRGFVWKIDVSDFRPLLRGKQKVEVWCGTYAQGWKASVAFDFYSGPTDRMAYKVVNLWQGEPEVGNPDKPTSAFFTPRTLAREPKADAVKVRFVVTGHGMEPNSDNAAEFKPMRRFLTVGAYTWDNLLWKTDNYLNPCRPQGGTWKYDRAGWAPGDVVAPWEVEIPDGALPRGRSAPLTYRLAPYINTGRGKTWAPTHWIESQAIFYRRNVAPAPSGSDLQNRL